MGSPSIPFICLLMAKIADLELMVVSKLLQEEGEAEAQSALGLGPGASPDSCPDVVVCRIVGEAISTGSLLSCLEGCVPDGGPPTQAKRRPPRPCSSSK
jgi:hypothetical protein